MRYFKDEVGFNKQMKALADILEWKGFVLEEDHVYAHVMQYKDAFLDVKEWLEANGYKGEIEASGWYQGVDVYGLYDSNLISLEEMLEKQSREAESQFQDTISFKM